MITKFELIEPNLVQIAILYELLLNKKNSISHEETPSYLEHAEFVKNHPYRIWYLVYKDNDPIGSIYLTQDNSVGLSFFEIDKELITHVIKKIITLHDPLPPLKSLRSKYFHLNVSTCNYRLISIFKDIGFPEIQCTFAIKDSKEGTSPSV